MEITRQDLRMLGRLVTCDEAGTHFMSNPEFPPEWLDRMERLGMIEIHRPIHEPTGIPYDQEHWSVELTEEACRLGEAQNWGE